MARESLSRHEAGDHVAARVSHPAARWLWAIHRHRASLSAAPNFAYELCLKKISDQDLAGLDLGSWRIAFNGAEAVGARTVRQFSARFQACGFRPEAMYPVYGLAECALGLCFPPLSRAPWIDVIERDPFLRGGEARPPAGPAAAVLQFVACGPPLPGHYIRVVGPTGRELPSARKGDWSSRALGHRRLLSQPPGHAPPVPWRMAGQRRPGLYRRRRGVYHRSRQGRHHTRRAPHLSR